MILTKELKIKVNNKNKKHFTDLGYDTSKKEILIKTEDLMKGSYYKIDVKCDICGEERRIPYAKYLKNYNNYNIYTCLKCSRNYKNTKTNFKKNGIEGYKMKKDNLEKYQKIIEKRKKLISEHTDKLEKDGGKICKKCHTFKSINSFSKRKNSLDGRNNICKNCINKKRRDNYEEKKDILLPIYKERKKKYLKNNKIKINKQQREYYHNKFKITNKMNFIWRSLLTTCLRRMNKTKNDKTIVLLGYSALDLKKHIENQFTTDMTWDNHGDWHIDHKVPVSSFDKNTHPSVVNALSNLQPLWKTNRIINGVLYEGNLNKGKKF